MRNTAEKFVSNIERPLQLPAAKPDFVSRIVLHVGAHRTGTTLFQEYLRRSTDIARKSGIFVRGIAETRRGLLRNIMYREIEEDLHDDRGALGELRESIESDSHRVLISDENILGTMEGNFLSNKLYPDPVERVSRIGQVLPEFDTIYLSIRPYTTWWMSAFSYLQSTGRLVFNKDMFERIAENDRGWPQIVSELLEGFPEIRVIVREYRYQIDNPKRQFREVTGWRDLSDFPNYRQVTNKSVGLEKLEMDLRDQGRIRLADALRSDSGFGPFTEREYHSLQERYTKDVWRVVLMLRDRGRLLIDPETKRKIIQGKGV